MYAAQFKVTDRAASSRHRIQARREVPAVQAADTAASSSNRVKRSPAFATSRQSSRRHRVKPREPPTVAIEPKSPIEPPAHAIELKPGEKFPLPKPPIEPPAHAIE